MGTEVYIAVAALIVSLVALFTTTGQLLQQYFATAEGYRRCQPSVMGLWAQRTKLRWRWREFRFETIFTIPRITYGPVHGDVGTAAEISSGRCSLVNNEESLRTSMTLGGWGSHNARKYYDSDELACWVPLLAQLHKQGEDTMRYFSQDKSSVANDPMIPVVQFIQKSWDFMPTDIVRPMASSTVSDVAIIARRMGLVWKSFDPAAGLMRAEGNGHVITSTMARSFGTILQYTFTSRDNAGSCCYVPVKEADKLGFGLVEFDHRLFGPEMRGDLDVSSIEGISQTLFLLVTGFQGRESAKGMDRALRKISSEMQEGKYFIPGFNDLVPLCSAMLSERAGLRGNRWLNRIPSPNLFHKGVTASAEGFRVFEKRLEHLIDGRGENASKQSKAVLSALKVLQLKYGSRWADEKDWELWDPSSGSGDKKYVPPQFLNEEENEAKNLVRAYHAQMTEYLQQSRVYYTDLVIEHILSATNARDLKYEQRRQPPPHVQAFSGESIDIDSDPELVASMEHYFIALEDVVTSVLYRHRLGYLNDPLTPGEVEDAWLSMMFRAFCWQRSHVMIPGVAPLPSEYWNSKMPVYIG